MDWGCDIFCCVDIGVTLGMFASFMAGMIVSEDVSVRTADIETLGAIYIHRDVPVILGVPICSETQQRWS